MKNRKNYNVMAQQFSEQFKVALENIAGQLYNATLKEAKKAIKAEGKDYQTGYQQGYVAGKNTVLENFPMWRIAPCDDYVKETVLALAGEFGRKIIWRGQLIKAGWKYISVKALRILPVEVDEVPEEPIEIESEG